MGLHGLPSFSEPWRWSFHLIVGYTPRELLYDKPQYGVVLALDLVVIFFI